MSWIFTPSPYSSNGCSPSAHFPSGYPPNRYFASEYPSSGYSSSRYPSSGCSPNGYLFPGCPPSSGYPPSEGFLNGYIPGGCPPGGFSPSGIAPPNQYKGLVLAIQGLPSICDSPNGWKLVKDLLRRVLARHGLLEPKYRKPGMVHIKTTNGMTSAQCNMKTPDAAIYAWWEIAGHTWCGSSLKAAVWSSPDFSCWFDSAKPLNGRAPYDLMIAFPVKFEGVFPRSKDKTDAVPMKDSGEDPSSKKRPAPVQDLRPVQKRCTSSVRNAAISCPPFERSLDQRSPPLPYTSPVNRGNEGRGRRIRRAANGTRQGHTHTAIPEAAVDDHVEATTNV